LLQYRSTLLRVLMEICRDGQLLVDMFVNYDCDIDSSNLFERMVNALVRIAQQPPVVSQGPPVATWSNVGWAGARQSSRRASYAVGQHTQLVHETWRHLANSTSVELGRAVKYIS
jgi:hypothetical protein